MKYYVYIIFDWDGLPLYVGQGQGDRWIMHERSAANGKPGFMYDILREMQDAWMEIPKVKIHECLDGETALKYEHALINAIGVMPNGPLTNKQVSLVSFHRSV